MPPPINVPLNAQVQNTTQLTQQIQAALNAARLNLGNGSRAFSSLSQPLGRLTGQANEFTKSMEAANARVLAFGASVGIVNAVSNAFKALVASTIEVEKALKEISVVGDQFGGDLKSLGNGIFDVARKTGQGFAEVSKAALEFARQGLNMEDTLQRTKDALILTRTTGLDASKAVEGLTAAVNGFSKAGLSTTQILNKLAAVDQAFAVSSADLIEGFNRSAAVAQNAGITFDELAGIITALQQETSRGGAVIGNALKTIFTRLQDTSTLTRLQDLGVAIQDVEGNILPARQILQNLAKDVEGLGQITKAGIFKDVAGTFQINQLISLVGDLNKEQSVAAAATRKSASATNEAYVANEKLNQSLDAILNKVAQTGKQLGSILGELGLSDSLKGILETVNSFLDGANKLLQGDDIGSKFAKGFVKGIGSVLTGPGLLVIGAVIVKLSADLLKFGAQSLKVFFNVGQAAREQKQIQESIVQTLLSNQSVLNTILNTQGGQNAQALRFLGILNQQQAAMKGIQTLAAGIAGTAYGAGYRPGAGGLTRRSAGGYLPAQEAADVRRGVGGASPSSKVVAIPNFAFGGGKRGTMIANTSEYIVPNYAGGGSAIFNQDMVNSMGLPAGAKKISAAGGFIPNFARTIKDVGSRYALITNDIRNEPRPITVNPEKDKDVAYQLFSYGIPTTQKVKSGSGGAFQDSRFTNSKLIEKYTELALNEANAYSMAIGGNALGPYEKQKVTQPGVVAGLVGSIFENGIAGVIKGARFKRAQAERKSNAIFDFFRQPSINKTFGIPKGVNYIEAKYTDASKGNLDSLANKIYNAESGSYQQPEKSLSQTERARLQALADKYQIGKSGKSRKEIKDARDIFKRTQDFQTIQAYGIKASARGYIPNFAASALQQAIAREKSAGLSNSQIYIDQNPSLKSPLNPMGLMVANTRDEPFGGAQGIARARKEGANPKTYGAAGGFVPNFFSYSPSSPRYASGPTSSAPAPSIPAANTQNNLNKNAEQASKGLGDIAGKLIVFQSALSFLQGGFTEAGSTANKVAEGFSTLVTAAFALQAVTSLSAKSMKDIDNSIKAQAREARKAGKSGGFRQSLRGEAASVIKSGNKRGGILGAGQRAYGGLLKDASRSFAAPTAGSLAGVAGAGLIALKSFNDIASLMYTRSSSLDSNLKSLSLSASKASAALSEVDKIASESAAGGLKNIDGGGSLALALSSLNPFNLGRQQVGYNAGGSTQTTLLTGGQTAQDFAQVQQDLSSLVFSSLKAQFKDNPNVDNSYLKTQTQTEVASLIQQATKDGVLDIESIFQLDSVKQLMKDAEDTSIILERMNNEVARQKPFAILGESIEKVIFDTNKLFNDEINSINAFSEKVRAIQGSKAFANLSFEQQYGVNLTQVSKDFENSFRKRQIELVQQSQKIILDKLPKLVEGEDFEIGQQLAKRLKGAKSTQEISLTLTEFQSKLSSIDSTKAKEALEAIGEVQNNISTYNSELDTGRRILQLQREDLLKTTQAQVEFRDKFVDFTDSIGKAQRSLVEFKGKLERIDIRTQSNIANRSLFATSRQEVLDIKREETLKGLSDKQGTEADIAFRESIIEARKQSFTQENLIALNSNTEAIRILTATLVSKEIEAIEKKAKSFGTLEAEENYLKGTYRASTDLPSEQPISIAQRLSYLKSLENPTVTASNVGQKAEDIFAVNPETGESQIRGLAQSAQSLQEFITQTTNTFKLNEQQALLFRPQLISIYESLKSQATIAQETAKTEKARLDSEQELLNLSSDYRASLSAMMLDLETKLETEPMTQGEYRATLRQRSIYARERDMSPEDVRRERSSFGRGMQDSLAETQKEVDDFEYKLGTEIPQLFSSNLAQGLNDAISGAKSLKDALTDAAISFLNAISQASMQNLANKLVVGISGLGNIGKASGGLIKGGSGTKDDVPAMLMGGEYVIKKSAVNKYGSSFLNALNKGQVKGFAKGGGVQSGAGGFYVPGDYGEGSIRGKGNLLAFAGQSFTSGQYDQMGGFGSSGAFVNLEAESARLTTLGRENSPLFERVQQTKEEAFKVYLEQLNQEKQYRDQLKQFEEAQKQREKQLTSALIQAAASVALNVVGSAAASGFKNAAGIAKANNQGIGGQFTAGLGGIFKGGGGQGGLGNLFSGNFSAAFNSGKNIYGGTDNKQYMGYSLGNVSYPYKRATGGMIYGGSGVRDDVPAMLTGGEFVLNNRATRKLGVQNLNRLNSGESGGGEDRSAAVTESLLSKLDELIQATRESSGDNVVVNVSSSEAGNASNENGGGNERDLQRKIRAAVLEVIAQEKRLGGSLNKNNR